MNLFKISEKSYRITAGLRGVFRSLSNIAGTFGKNSQPFLAFLTKKEGPSVNVSKVQTPTFLFKVLFLPRKGSGRIGHREGCNHPPLFFFLHSFLVKLPPFFEIFPKSILSPSSNCFLVTPLSKPHF